MSKMTDEQIICKYGKPNKTGKGYLTKITFLQ